MGIKGLFSILSSEPNRFGQRFVANKADDVDIYIDAPALLYHLLHLHEQLTNNKDGHCRRFYPQLFERIGVDSSRQSSRSSYSCPSLSQLPPKTIYDLTQAFCLTLKNSIGQNSNIHVVLDGVASTKKMKQQVDRLKSVAIKLDDSVKVFQTRLLGGGKVCWDSTATMVPHLFGEDAMIQAVRDLQSIQNSISCRDEEGGHFAIHFAPWEAEGYIANNLVDQNLTMEQGMERSCCIKRKQIVLSNDTDFLVFPTITGIIPLHSLEYVLQKDNDIKGDGCDWNIHGWIFLREKFVRSYSLVGDKQKDCSSTETGHDILILSTIAALAGCDYTLSGKYMDRLNAATKTIIKSDLGGLRQRSRNNPSAKDTITAVVRFVSHFASRYDKRNTNDLSCIDRGDELWLTKLTEAVIKTEISLNRRGSKRKSKNTMKRDEIYQEEQQQILKNALHEIRDVYNDNCCDSVQSIVEHSPTFHYMQELRRLLRHNIIFCKPVIEIKRFQSRDMSDESNRRESLWTESAFVQCRSRICSLIQCNFNGERGNSNAIVTEYCCSNGANDSVDYTSSRFEIQSDIENCRLFLSSESNEPKSLLQYIFFGFHGDIASGRQTHYERNTIPDCEHSEHLVLFLASLLLKLDDALMLFLMAMTPALRNRTMDVFHENHTTTFLMGSFIRSQSLIQIAAFHAKLGVETVQCIIDNDEDGQKELPAIEHSHTYKIFRDDFLARFLWVSIKSTCRDNRQSVGDEELSMILDGICYEFNFEREHGKWQESIRNLWRIRQKLEEIKCFNK